MSTPSRSPRVLPRIIYGTAWKEQATERLVGQALKAGFVAIDTANQRRHYHEAGVGAALATALAEGKVTRESLWLQTKFTDRGGQDHRLPYDATAEVETQVQQSFASSLEHLGVTWLDSYVLHGPSTRSGINEHDRRIWRAMEALAMDGKVRSLGVSNMDRAQIETICRIATVAPTYVQNRCYAKFGWDREVRALCRDQRITYQGFSLLTANPQVVGHYEVQKIASALDVTPAQVVFAFTQHLGILPLTGTTNEQHMREDLVAVRFQLGEEELNALESIAGR